MTKDVFIQELKKLGFDFSFICWEPSPARDGVYHIYKNYYRWEVYYQERGNEYEKMGFVNESEALDYLFGKLMDLSKYNVWPFAAKS